MHGRIHHSTGHVVPIVLLAMVLVASLVLLLPRAPAALQLQEVRPNATNDGVEILASSEAVLTAHIEGHEVKPARTSSDRFHCGPEELLAAGIDSDAPRSVSLHVTSADGSTLTSRPFLAPWWRVSEVSYPSAEAGSRVAEFQVEVFPESIAHLVAASACKVLSRESNGDGAALVHFRALLPDHDTTTTLSFGRRRKHLKLLGLPATWMTRDSDSVWQVRETSSGWYLHGESRETRHWCQAEQELDASWRGESWLLVLAYLRSTEFSIYFHTLVHVELRPADQALIWTVGGKHRKQVQDESPNLDGNRYDDDDDPKKKSRKEEDKNVRIVHRPKHARCLRPNAHEPTLVRLSLTLENQRLRLALQDVDGNEVSAISLPSTWMQESGPRCGLGLWQDHLDVLHFESRRA